MDTSIRESRPTDERAFRVLWMDYLREREAAGSPFAATDSALDFYTDLWRQVVDRRMDGVSLIVPDICVNLWGPPCPAWMKGGPGMIGQGSYVRPAFRRGGVGAEMYRQGFALLRQRGYRLFVGSVDAGNELGERNATRLKGRVIQTTEAVEL